MGPSWNNLPKILFTVVFILIFWVGRAAFAQFGLELNVNSTLDEIDAVPGDGSCISTPSGDCTLRAAIMETNAFPGLDRVNVLGGLTYTLTIAGTSEDASATGDLDITDNLLLGGSLPPPIIDANGIDRVFHIDPGFTGIVSVQIVTMTIQGGNAGGGGCILNFANLGPLEPRGLVLSSVTIRDCVATEVGGGLWNSGSVEVDLSTINNNLAETSGGGIFNNAGELDVTNSTVSGNTALVSAGGIFNETSAVLRSSNSTIFGNTGGIVSYGDTTLNHTIVANNTPIDCILDSGATHLSDFSLDSDGTCFSIGGTDLVGVDPLLEPLALNGNPEGTQTHALMAVSPAIDAGDNNICIVIDQRFVIRPQDGDNDSVAVCDIGAYEFVPPCTPSSCDDGITCTVDTCDLTEGCLHTPDNLVCADNNMCTSGEVCDPAHQGADPVTGCFRVKQDCDDQDKCTTDKCNPNTGQCEHKPIPKKSCP